MELNLITGDGDKLFGVTNIEVNLTANLIVYYVGERKTIETNIKYTVLN
jgi:hypothetical protein